MPDAPESTVKVTFSQVMPLRLIGANSCGTALSPPSGHKLPRSAAGSNNAMLVDLDVPSLGFSYPYSTIFSLLNAYSCGSLNGSAGLSGLSQRHDSPLEHAPKPNFPSNIVSHFLQFLRRVDREKSTGCGGGGGLLTMSVMACAESIKD